MFFIPPSGGIKKEKGETFMPISITARHASITEEIKDYARQKLEALEHLWPRDTEAHLVIEAEKAGYFLEINLQSGHYRLNSQARNRNLQTAVNKAVRKLEKQLKKVKEKTSRRRKVKAQVPYAPEDLPADIPLLVKVPDARIEELGEREASLKLREGKFSFFLYRSAESGKLSVIFRRGSGDLGLMEIPER
jgi:putative sigma-54 modulation protein